MSDDSPERNPSETKPRAWARPAKWFAICVAVLVTAPVWLTVLVRFVDPPVSAYMLIRVLEGEGLNREWRDLEEISEHLIRGTIATEDARFCAHRGVDWVELEKVLEEVREGSDGRVRGASTITMQTVKNLILWPSPSYLRKAVEIPLAYWMDFVMPKARIVEIYLNIVEWAPGVYGAQAASRHHFGKDADALSRDEAALLVAVLPNPVERNASRPGSTTRRAADRVRRRMETIGPYLTCL